MKHNCSFLLKQSSRSEAEKVQGRLIFPEVVNIVKHVRE